MHQTVRRVLSRTEARHILQVSHLNSSRRRLHTIFKSLVNGIIQPMHVTFKKHKTRRNVSVAASYRIGGKIRYKHILFLGSIAEPAFVQDRSDFWNKARERLWALKESAKDDYLQIVARLEQRIPPLSQSELLELATKNDRPAHADKPSFCADNSDPFQRPWVSKINDSLALHNESSFCTALLAALEKESKTAIAVKSGNDRTTIYRAFQHPNHPLLSTVLNVLDALGLQFYCHSEVPRREAKLLKFINEGFALRDTKLICDECAFLIKRASVVSVAAQAGMTRTSLYRWLRTGRSPTFRSVMNILKALRVTLSVKAKNSRHING